MGLTQLQKAVMVIFFSSIVYFWREYVHIFYEINSIFGGQNQQSCGVYYLL
jgi:hypothetical protein